MSGPPRDAAAFEVLDALGEQGCSVCRLTMRSVGRQLQAIAYEQVNDIALRAQLRSAGGFCNPHAYRWLHEARSVLGTALIYRDVLRAGLEDLQGGGSRGGLLRGLFGARGGTADCPACRVQEEAEARYVEVLVALIASDAQARQALERSQGLCRRHTSAALRMGGPGADYVRQNTQKTIAALVRELDEVIRKEDYRFRDEPRTASERSAPARAIGWAAGGEGLV